jgi:transposase-like protein
MMKARWIGIAGLDGSVYGDGSKKFVLEVKAAKVDIKYIEYECQFCKGTHRHGSSGEFHNRTEHRSSHCQKNRKHKVEIIIDDATPRVYP